MKAKQRVGWAVLVLAILVAAGSVSFQSSRTFEFVTPAGTLANPVYVAYAYRGSRPNFVHPVSYEARPLALLKSNEAGRVVFERAVILHRPFPIETHPALWTEMVYAPTQHNAWGQLNPGSPSTARVFEIDVTQSRATVWDLSDHPDRWEGTMRNLASVISRLIYTREGEVPLPERDPTSTALTRELIGHFRKEYDGFLERYATVTRPQPEIPGEQQWGMVATRLFKIQLRQFEEWAARQ